MERGELDHCFIEINMCRDGCVNGPGSGTDTVSRFASRVRIRDYAYEDAESYPNLPETIPMQMQFVDRSSKEDIPDEETIRAILAKIGKNGPEDELNCGSCGYKGCDDYARALVEEEAPTETALALPVAGVLILAALSLLSYAISCSIFEKQEP